MPDKFTNRRRATGAGLYDAMGIAYDDKQARWDAMKLNWEFFGAPVGLFFSIDKFMGKNQWCHLGMMMQNISLLAIENGLATCMQEAIFFKAIDLFIGTKGIELRDALNLDFE